MKATTSVLALVAVAGAQAGSIHKRHGHHKRGDYANVTPTTDASSAGETGLCKEVTTGKWVELRDVRPPPVTYHPAAPCTVPAPVITPVQPGTYVFPEQNVELTAPVDYNGQHYEPGKYCQQATTYDIKTATTITCTFGYTAPSPAPQAPQPPPPPPPPPPQNYGSQQPGQPGGGYNGGNQGGGEGGGEQGGHGGDNGGEQGGHGGGYGGGPKGGKQWAITYSPYQDAGGCKPAGAIADDIGQIASKGFSAVRVYSTDCGTLEAVGPACKAHGIKMIVGAFIKNDGMVTANKDVDNLCNWGKQGNWGLVDMVVLGNEAIQGGQCSYDQLVGFIKAGSAKLKGCGCNAPVTTAETLNIYEKHKDLCNYIDVAGFNCHPFFNAQTTPEKSGAFVKAELAELSGICNGKKAYSLETGWPNGGNANGAAVPGPGQQAQAFKSIYNEADEGNIAYFTFRNDGWKGPGAYNVEQRFGCGDVFRSGGGVN